MALHFVKMHGCGNDFVILDERATLVELSPHQVAALADRHRGIGFDQLIRLESAEDADALMRIRNPDGSEAGACGNATRCVADILMRETGRRRVTVRTAAGILPSERRSDGLIQVNMGKPKLDWVDIPLAHEADTLSLDLPGSPAAASMGNPHVTFLVDDLDRIPVGQLGPRFETDALFPDRANIGFAQVLARDAIRLKVWERGAGLTLACGSGACATVVNAHRRGLADRQAKVILDGGELHIDWLPDGDVLMAGPVATVFKGEASLT